MANETLKSKKIIPTVEIKRKKKIFVPDGSLWWAKTHAMNPTVDVLDDRIRVYFSSLDKENVGRIGYVDLDKNNPEKIITVSKEPVLDIGDDGMFDDNGVIPSCIMNYNGKKYLYFYGFQLLKKVRFSLFTGVAVSDDEGLTFKRCSQTPLLDRLDKDPFIRSLPFMMEEKNSFSLWYNGVCEWTEVKGKKLPVGNIRRVESNSPLNFSESEIINCLSPQTNEFSLSRPFIFKMDDLYKMLFSVRDRATDSYKPGYAESKDGKVWFRNDSELKVSESVDDWDKDMMCYTTLTVIDNKNYLFYNGNGFGATGFGYAEINF
ncbi:MAG: hypothetical protein Q8N66_06310 [Bacteroidota bacterium]|nr:hypothetical protein [Bacteroidota bacterium]